MNADFKEMLTSDNFWYGFWNGVFFLFLLELLAFIFFMLGYRIK